MISFLLEINFLTLGLFKYCSIFWYLSLMTASNHEKHMTASSTTGHVVENKNMHGRKYFIWTINIF